jgi:acyl carrier protein
MDPVHETLRIIAEVSSKPADAITRDTELVADLALDSAKAFELLVKLEDGLGVDIEEEDAAGLNTVGDILDLLATKLG